MFAVTITAVHEAGNGKLSAIMRHFRTYIIFLTIGLASFSVADETITCTAAVADHQWGSAPIVRAYQQRYFSAYAYAEDSYASVSGSAGYMKIANRSQWNSGSMYMGPNGTRSANGWVSWDDMATIDSPGHAGETGHMDALVHVTGIFSDAVNNSGMGVLAAEHTVVIGTPDPLFGWTYGGLWLTPVAHSFSVNGSQTEDVWVDVPYDFTFGKAFDFGLRVSVTSNVNYGMYSQGDAWSDCDFSHTVTWQGIKSITTASGTTLGDATASTAGGKNLYAPVPEPGAMMSLILGLPFLLRRSRRA